MYYTSHINRLLRPAKLRVVAVFFFVAIVVTIGVLLQNNIVRLWLLRHVRNGLEVVCVACQLFGSQKAGGRW